MIMEEKKIKYGRGKNPNSHKHKVTNGGRKRKYAEDTETVAFRAPKPLLGRLAEEAERRGITKAELFVEMMKDLPPTAEEKVKDIEERYRELRDKIGI